MSEVFGWFPPDSQLLLDKLMAQNGIKTVIEIGAFLGKSTIFFAQRCDRVITIDPFTPTDREYTNDPKVAAYLPNLYEHFLHNIVTHNVQDKITVLKMTSAEAARDTHLVADLVFIDGSHQYLDVKNDLALWYPRARKVICGDDYTDMWRSTVCRAVDEASFTANTSQRIWYYEKL